MVFYTLDLFFILYDFFLLHKYSLGAAMVGDTLFVPSVVSRLIYNPLCMMRYENDRLAPDEWENVRILSLAVSFMNGAFLTLPVTGLYHVFW